VIEGGFLLCSTSWITLGDLKYLHWSPAAVPRMGAKVSGRQFPLLTAASEPDRIRQALEATHWNKSKAAELLQWSRMTLYRKISKYNLSPSEVSPDGHEPKAFAAGR
jgi:DNA-binding NtrC family response regulator